MHRLGSNSAPVCGKAHTVLGGAGAEPTSVKVVKVVKAATSLSSDTLDVGTDRLSSCSGQFDDPVAEALKKYCSTMKEAIGQF